MNNQTGIDLPTGDRRKDLIKRIRLFPDSFLGFLHAKDQTTKTAVVHFQESRL